MSRACTILQFKTQFRSDWIRLLEEPRLNLPILEENHFLPIAKGSCNRLLSLNREFDLSQANGAEND
jgi:hypothetical protein